MNWLGLKDQGVLVAGAGGIGGACAKAYADAGARVLVVDRDPARLAELRHLADGQERLATMTLDLLEPDAGEQGVAAALQGLGRLDVVLHAVGTNDRRPVLELTPQDWDRVVGTNLTSAFALAQAAGRHMVDQGSGRIVLLSSVSGLLAHRLHAPYAASKGGMNQMMRVMAAEWAANGVTVNAVAPGYVETDLTRDYLAQSGVRDGLTSMVPAGRLGVAQEVVGPVMFLSSAQAAFVTGHVLYVDGGRTLV